MATPCSSSTNKRMKNEAADKLVLRQQIIRLGRTRGDFVAVEEGINEGEMVVTSGVFKLRPKMSVVVDNSLALDARLEPNPVNK